MNSLLGARIRELREKKGYTQEELAGEINCSRQKLARMEKGLLDITYSNILLIADILKIKIEEITSIVNTPELEVKAYRVDDSSEQTEYAADTVDEMLDVLFAHRNLYMKTEETNL